VDLCWFTMVHKFNMKYDFIFQCDLDFVSKPLFSMTNLFILFF